MKQFKRYKWIPLLLVVLLMASVKARSAEMQSQADYSYYTLEPDIVANYTNGNNKLSFIRIGIGFMLKTPEDRELLAHHEPLLRAAILNIIGSKTAAQIQSIDGREAIRHQCFETVKRLLIEETGRPLVVNLLFTQYLYR